MGEPPAKPQPVGPQSGGIQLRPGDPIGHYLGPTGTVGLKVRRIGENTPLALSCSHVLARCGYATQGDLIEAAKQPEDLILQLPVGTLDAFTTLRTEAPNDEDFALCLIDSSVSLVAEIPGIGLPQGVPNIAAKGFDAFQGTEVQRLGSARGLQPGVIRGYTGSVFVRDLPIFGPTLVEYVNAVAYNTVCDHGDSGSAVISSNTREVLGIHIGGDPGEQIGYFCPVGEFMNQLGLELFPD